MIFVYDNRFNLNEWFTIIALLTGIVLVLKLKKIFSIKQGLLYFLFGVFIGFLFDHTISVWPVDYYDVNDNSTYQFMDFLTYLMYGPFSYLFAYAYNYFKVKLSFTPLYILVWSLVAFFMEFLAKSVGVFHYKNGYTIFYSFPIYLIVYSMQSYLYRFLTKEQR